MCRRLWTKSLMSESVIWTFFGIFHHFVTQENNQQCQQSLSAAWVQINPRRSSGPLWSCFGFFRVFVRFLVGSLLRLVHDRLLPLRLNAAVVKWPLCLSALELLLHHQTKHWTETSSDYLWTSSKPLLGDQNKPVKTRVIRCFAEKSNNKTWLKIR